MLSQAESYTDSDTELYEYMDAWERTVDNNSQFGTAEPQPFIHNDNTDTELYKYMDAWERDIDINSLVGAGDPQPSNDNTPFG